MAPPVVLWLTRNTLSPRVMSDSYTNCGVVAAGRHSSGGARQWLPMDQRCFRRVVERNRDHVHEVARSHTSGAAAGTRDVAIHDQVAVVDACCRRRMRAAGQFKRGQQLRTGWVADWEDAVAMTDGQRHPKEIRNFTQPALPVWNPDPQRRQRPHAPRRSQTGGSPPPPTRRVMAPQVAVGCKRCDDEPGSTP